jgi:outer membrane immunogenic protein
MRKIFAAGIGAIAMAVALPAAAADLPKKAPIYKAPPVVVDPWTWTGIYIGLNGGYSWGRSRTHVDYFNTLTGLAIVPPPGSITDVDFNLNGGIFGGQIGGNMEINRIFLIGLEADLQWSGQKGSADFRCAAVAILAGPCLPGLTFLPAAAAGGTTLHLDQKLEWFGTVRGRLGVLFAPTVVGYVTGGWAFGEIQTDGTLSGFTPAAVPVSTVFSHSQTKSGWTIGDGIEGRLWDNWTGKLEYLYMDLGTVAGTASLAPASTIGINYSSRITDNIIRVGINYKFGPYPVMAKN